MADVPTPCRPLWPSSQRRLRDFHLQETSLGLLQLYKDFKATVPSSLGQPLTDVLTGLKKTRAEKVQAGQITVRVGKDPLKMADYRWLAEHLLKSDDRGTSFAHCLLILSWNLICRVSNAVGICFDHMQWTGDALGM